MPKLDVSLHVIQPLEQWFGKPISAGRAEVYEEVLATISPRVLQLAIKQLKQEWTQQSCPQPSVVLAHSHKAQEIIASQQSALALNFGQLSNGQICSCGKHHGVGQWSPQKRAQSCAWHRHTQHHYHGHIKHYLESFEHAHGPVISTHHS